MNRRSFSVAAAAATLVPRPVKAQGAPFPLTVAMTVVNYDAAPLYYAQSSGMFAEAGLRVEITRISSGAATAAAVASRTIDIGKSTTLSVIEGYARGVPLTIVAPAAIYDAASPDGQLVVAADSPIRTAADLNGKLLASGSLDSIDAVGTMAWVDTHGGNAQSLHYVELALSAIPQALVQHRIDAAFLTEPVLSDAIASGKVRPIIPILSAIGKRFLFSVWFASLDFARAQPDVVHRFTTTIIAAQDYVNTHHRNLAPLVAQLSGLPVAEVANAKLATCGTTLTRADLQSIIDTGAKYKAIPQAFDARQIIFREIGGRT